jgi:hypothetical protein
MNDRADAWLDGTGNLPAPLGAKYGTERFVIAIRKS